MGYRSGLRFIALSIVFLLILISTPSTLKSAEAMTFNGDTSTQWPTHEWEISTPEDQGMNSTLFNMMDYHIDRKGYALHGLTVARNGYLIHESYPDWRYNADTRHRVFSVTKSVGSILIGIAIDKGFISSVDERVIDFFPDYTIANLDGRKENMTIEHILTMTCGVEWWEWGIPLEDPTNSYYNFSTSENHIQYFLDLPMEYEPGEVWVYNSASITLLSHILYRATGMTPLQFAEEYLFGPLGINTVYWIADRFGVECMSGTLYLTPREMIKIAHLMLNNGSWNDDQIVSEDWVDYSTSQIVEQPYHNITPGYGYLWWISPEFGFYCAQGRFGQRIFIIPEYNIVLAFTCHINDWLIQPWDYFIEEFIIPALIGDNAQTSTETSETTNLQIHSILLLSAIGIIVIIVAWKQQKFRRFFKQSNYCSIKIPNPSIISL
jgi:CubicO group peptidase (beta-lactamase class C family)